MEENDDQYEEEEGGEVADEFDSDFNDDVSILRRCFSYVEIFMPVIAALPISSSNTSVCVGCRSLNQIMIL
ncbi:hypothetical protein Droror1_Dr00003846 [Drosera rotundifolia]